MPVDVLDIHDKVDAGLVFFVSHTFPSVPIDGSVYLRHVSGSKHLHSILSLTTTGKWEFQSFAGTIYTGDGTAVSSINRRSDSKEVLESIFYHTPAINVLGSERLGFTFGSGTTPSRATTAVTGDQYESIFAPGADVLVRLTNRSGAVQYLSAIFNVYEELLN